jgi:uncharacterized membrane protein YsdA (DUF1294 family)
MLIPYLATLGVISLTTLILYAVDKSLSKKDGARIPELTLLTFTAMGGAVGAFFGMFALRHKVDFKRKFHFTITLFISLILQIAGVCVMAYLQFK